MAAMAATHTGHGSHPALPSIQDKIDEIVDKEVGIILAYLCPNDDIQSRMSLPSVQQSMTRLKAKLFIEEELRVILKVFRPDDQPSSLLAQVPVQKAISMLRQGVFALFSKRHDSQVAMAARPPMSSVNETQEQEDHPESLRGGDMTATLASRMDQPSLMSRRFHAHNEAFKANPEAMMADHARQMAAQARGREHDRKSKELYFFYGSLMDPQQLQHVLGLVELPTNLTQAHIIGRKVRMWGCKSAIVRGGDLGAVVQGIAYEVEGAENKSKLDQYVTDSFVRAGCIIRMQEGQERSGKMFVWNGDDRELQDGSFDLEEWQNARSLEEEEMTLRG